MQTERKCVICKKTVKLIYGDISEGPENLAWDGGAVFRDTVGYGSRFDMKELIICLCDECIEKNLGFLTFG
jgi:hypothetical protein